MVEDPLNIGSDEPMIGGVLLERAIVEALIERGQLDAHRWNADVVGEANTPVSAERHAQRATAIMMLADDFPPHLALVDAGLPPDRLDRLVEPVRLVVDGFVGERSAGPLPMHDVEEVSASLVAQRARSPTRGIWPRSFQPSTAARDLASPRPR